MGTKDQKNNNVERALLGLFDFEKQRTQRKKLKPFTLDRIRSALDLLGHPEQSMRIFHIAGTKGKGSTLEYLYRLLKTKTNYKIGKFTSPHLIRLQERIRVDGVDIEDEALLRLSEQVDQLNREYFDREITYFEVMLLIALLYFKEQQTEIVILETGLGGRLDATNVVDSELSIITKIDYDHMDVLGNTLELIASEKAGIIKDNANTLALKQDERVCQVIQERSDRMNANLEWVDVQEGYDPAKENASIALAAARKIFPNETVWPSLEELTSRGIPGRLQFLNYEGNQILIDSAHNEVSLKALKKKCVDIARPLSLCFALSEGRDWEKLLSIVLPIVDEVVFSPLPGGRPGVGPSELEAVARKLWPCIKTTCWSNYETSLSNWMSDPYQGIKIISGSFYLAGEALKIIEEK